mgnify:FL=1
MKGGKLFGIIALGYEQRRLWPLDLANRPFACRPFFGGKTLLEASFERMRVLIPDDRIWVIAPQSLLPLVASLLPGLDSRRLYAGSGTNPGDLYALTETISLIDPDGQVVFSPAGIIAGDDQAFSDLVHDAARLAHATGCIVSGTVSVSGIRAGYPCILPGDACIRSGRVFGRDIRRYFPSVPSADAEAISARGAVWATGIHVWNTATFLVDVLGFLAGQQDMDESDDLSSRFFSQSKNWLMVESALVWDPMRSFEDLARYIRGDGSGNSRSGHCIAGQTRNSIILSDNPGGLVVVHGLHDVLVVQTGETILCCSRGDEEGVNRLLSSLAGIQQEAGS